MKGQNDPDNGCSDAFSQSTVNAGKSYVNKSWATTSTVATVGHEEQGRMREDSMEVTLPTVPELQEGASCFPCSDGTRSCPKMALAMSVLFVVMFTLISSAILLTSSESGPNSAGGNNNIGMGLNAKGNDHYESFWNPILDLRVIYDPTNSSRYILRDEKNVSTPSIVPGNSQYDEQQLEWSEVQPTPQSIAVMGMLPHIQTTNHHYLRLFNSRSIDLGPGTDWTLSFSGAHLQQLKNKMADNIFMGESSLVPKASFAICYRANNSIGLGSCRANDKTTKVVPLPFSVMEFHVLTVSYNQRIGSMQVYQNTRLAADLEFRNALEATNLSWIGPPCFGDTSSNSSSNIAIRHVAYLDKHINPASVVDIADLSLHMST